MNNKYVKMLGVGLLVVGLVGWWQSIITMDPDWKKKTSDRSKEYSASLQDAVNNAENNKVTTEELVNDFLPLNAQKEIFKNKPAHPFLLQYLISKLCPDLNKPIRTFKHDGGVFSVAFSPDGKYVLTGSGDDTAKIWNANTGKEIRTFQHDSRVYSVAFSPDGKYVLTGGFRRAKLWDANTGDLIHTFKHNDSANSVAFSSDGQYVLTGSLDRTAKLWDANTGKEIRTFRHNNWVASVAFSPDGKYVLAGGLCWAELWDANTGEEIHTFKHDGGVNSVAFSPDGKYVLAGSAGKTAKLWDVNTGEEIHTFKHDHWAHSVAFSPDGKYVLTGSEDRTAKLWDISCIAKLIKDMTFVTVNQYNLLQACGDILEKFLVKKEKLGRIYLNEGQQKAFDSLPQNIKKQLEFIVLRPRQEKTLLIG